MLSVKGRRSLVAAAAVAAGCAASACGGSSSPTPTSSASSTTATVEAPSASPTASLSPEQQAAEEAKAAYANYRKTLDAVFQRGGTNARQDLSRVAVGVQLSYLLNEASQFESQHVHAVGAASVITLHVRGVSFQKAKPPLTVLDVCTDASGNDAVDSNGRSVRKPGALNHFTEMVVLIKVGGKGWLVSQEDDTPVKSC